MAEVLSTMLAGALPTMLAPGSGSKNHFAAYDIEAFTDVDQFKDLDGPDAPDPADGARRRPARSACSIRACPSTRRWPSAAPTASRCTRKSSQWFAECARDLGLAPLAPMR